jgi:hypothetical protein
MDYIGKMIEAGERKGKMLTYKEWCSIRRNGSPDEIAEAVEKMMAQGGYDCLVED